MAKEWGTSDVDRRIQQAKRYSDKVSNLIHNEMYKKEQYTPKPGIKSRTISVYVEKGKLAAWQFLQEYNRENLSGNGFTLEMLEKWIVEYEKTQLQKAGKDDGFDR